MIFLNGNCLWRDILLNQILFSTEIIILAFPVFIFSWSSWSTLTNHLIFLSFFSHYYLCITLVRILLLWRELNFCSVFFNFIIPFLPKLPENFQAFDLFHWLMVLLFLEIHSFKMNKNLKCIQLPPELALHFVHISRTSHWQKSNEETKTVNNYLS